MAAGTTEALFVEAEKRVHGCLGGFTPSRFFHVQCLMKTTCRNLALAEQFPLGTKVWTSERSNQMARCDEVEVVKSLDLISGPRI